MVSEYRKVLPKGRIGKAIHYTYNIYHKLTRYHLDGRLKMDNNLGENAIRPVAMGRKAWLFCGNNLVVFPGFRLTPGAFFCPFSPFTLSN